jgi:hypothetical protein
MSGSCSTNGIDEKHIQGLVETPEEKRTIRMLRCKREDNIKIELKETVCDGVDWDRDQWRALVNTIMNLRFS